ncbi:hypothetical protein BKA69DRAFT_1081679 [Paraphysoderma sedebokerense]|nr:hypothetical protein BKA69DRAFT_1081679 [Paraphysoderma sedebokerense]
MCCKKYSFRECNGTELYSINTKKKRYINTRTKRPESLIRWTAIAKKERSQLEYEMHRHKSFWK